MSKLSIVLLVDDEDRVLSSLRRSLRREPFAIETAANASSALARIEKGPEVALVISDFRMPDMNGIELLTEIRKRSPGTARILLSGWTSEIPPADLEAAGLFAFLEKPWDDKAFKATIRRALGVDLPR